MLRHMKNNAKSYVFVLISLTVSMIAIGNIFHMDAVAATNALCGGIPLGHPLLKMSFLFFIVLIQYYNANVLNFFLNNTSVLLPRYEKRNLFFAALMKKIIIQNGLFIFTILLATFLSSFLLEESNRSINALDMLPFLIWILLFVNFCSVLQSVLLLYYTQTIVFFCFSIGAIVVTFLTQWSGVAIMSPRLLTGSFSMIALLVFAVLVVGSMIGACYLFFRKDWFDYVH